MYFKFPEDNTRFGWTRHIKNKMVFYNISAAQIMRIFTSPQRKEEGIAPGTIGAMRVIKHNINKTAPANGQQKKRETEIWIMYKTGPGTKKPANTKLMAMKPLSLRGKTTMISAWRYPGRTKPGERLPIPIEIEEELMQEGLIDKSVK